MKTADVNVERGDRIKIMHAHGRWIPPGTEATVFQNFAGRLSIILDNGDHLDLFHVRDTWERVGNDGP